MTVSSTHSYDELVQHDRVHRTLYTDPSIFDDEMRRVFGRTWVYLAHESQVPTPNSYRTGYLGLRPIIVTRDRAGELHALFNRCTHRAATVCRDESGTAKNFQCPYHGWTFKNTGQLVGVPWPDAYGPDFERTDLNLGVVPRVESYRGFVFGTLNADAPPLAEHLGPVREPLDYWIDRAPGGEVFLRNSAHRMVYRGNWKLAYDNAGDGYHPAFSHRSLLQMAERLGESKDMTYFGRTPDRGPMYVQYLGNGHTFIDQRPSYDGPGAFWANQRPQPGREVFEELIRSEYPDDALRYLDLTVGAQINLNIFPNLLIIGNQVQVIEPLAVDRTQLTWYATTVGGVPDEVNVLRMRTQEDFPAFGEPDDQANFEEAQRGLSIPEVAWVQMNRGFGVEGRQKVDADGVVTGPVTDELHMRGYYQEWLRLMSR
ncbi:aromatic ring-hydroxylating oxygenase subunit alpha [Rhodococcus aetherivorans]|jgi:phenylpropionate dioxygenase-like ring-hydroxylating dioxygenase large terminal subunit|uniref:3-phenylpropionate dioxygenase alpha subunit n=1 Tax=Rhodococcus aetherivorans TaxID=191292 RepID=A0A059MTT0_9NOCA|nr:MULTISPECIES: aromatic ring-hydroxylating dioxygenase subunit alpha [Rhodococcus]ETT25628.1 2-chlorobenzoate 1,2-dioxygenase [Rhodococcus rhodochrous ATCC 21198]ANZ25899.1 (2Fe-2S)-binding protein [Rhodococcus sp. WB1]KDE14427.1 (2Fe-2S)-binding protein [Rhodococcus aetherivorans]MDV6292403.1 aromatic ring-hydroxylating dioxygenase subunit alpha [Rhodococcus aetherivorans]NGP26172.1 Rieske 2Fe-2S domain-containing protein [Rhodococcus aetherivorans]